MSSRRFFILLLVVIGVLLTASSLFANNELVWPTYHYNSGHQGQNIGSTDLTGGTKMGLNWVFPRLKMTKKADNQTDINDDNINFFSATGWTLYDTAPLNLISSEAYESKTKKSDFYFINASTSDDPLDVKTAEWKFPDQVDLINGTLPASTSANGIYYNVYIWIPAAYTNSATNLESTIKNTASAHYTVISGSEYYTYTIDQSDTDTSGNWRLLTKRAFSFKDGDKVTLSNITSDADVTDTIVVADAIRFVPVTGMEIYSSPVSANLDVASYNASGKLGAAYVATVESPVGTSVNAPDTGSIYCINAAVEDAHAGDVGTKIWEYPNKTAASRAFDEGPIEGGFYSTPTLAYVADSSQPGDPQILALIVTGMDKQVYVFDAAGIGAEEKRTPRLLWQGPGLITGENTVASWTVASTRLDAFGGAFSSTPCVLTNPVTTSWTFTDVARQAKGEPFDPANPGANGWSYAVYAWMPAKLSTDPDRISDAVYTIHYSKPGAIGTAVTTVSVDQSNMDNQGKWVKLGSYFNVNQVDLSNITKNADSVTNADVVVADAIKIVPDAFEAFGYCTPIVNSNNLKDMTTNAGAIYAATSNGRVISFNTLPSKTFGQVNWVYPDIRTKLIVTGSGGVGAEQPDLGALSSSLAFNSDKIYLPTMDGKIYCIDTNTHAVVWTFDAYKGSEEPYGFSSSPVIDTLLNRLYAASINGDVFAVDLGDGSQVWKAPLLPDDAIGAVRFSTPVLAVDKNNVRRIWVASTDGFVHSYLASDGTKLIDTTTPIYNEPGRGFPIQGSVAMDGNATDPKIYFGDMNGVLRWYKAEDGLPVNINYNGWRTDGQLFSSPSISDITSSLSYVFVGGSDGRLYAFSENVFNGAWMQGADEWQFEGPSTGEAQKEAAYDPTTAEVQVDIFSKEFFDNSDVAGKAEPHDITVPTELTAPATTFLSAATTDWIVSNEMKLVDSTKYGGNPVVNTALLSTDLTAEAKKLRTALHIQDYALRQTGDTIFFEWGQSIYVVIWNLPGKAQLFGGNDSTKRANLKLSLTNNTADSSAGSIVTARVKTLEEYTILDSTTKAGDIYQPLKSADGASIKRSYALAQIDIKGTGSRPPSPGSAWTLSVEVKKTDSTGAVTSQEIIPLAKLSGTDPDPKKPQKLGINNPLAIRIDGGTEIAWNGTGRPVSTDPEAHVNGNPSGKMPTLTLGTKRFPSNVLDKNVVGHGSTSPQHVLLVHDRSAMGMDRDINSVQKQELTRVRINSNDLLWRGGLPAIATYDPALGFTYGCKFDWEFGIGSFDYPNISKKEEYFRNYYDDKNPATESSKLPGVLPSAGSLADDYLWSAFQPTSIVISVNVPKYQPANMTGYTRNMETYIDSDGNGVWNSGDVVLGRPSTYQEVYRRFKVVVNVPPDPKIEIDQQTIDLGNPPHGLGELNPVAAIDCKFFPINLADPYIDVASTPWAQVMNWFKPITVKNAGNVNLYNLRVGKDTMLYADPSKPTVPIDGHQIVSSLDNTLDSINIQTGAPFSTVMSIDGVSQNVYTLTKPRVGDVDPTVLQIPDQRKVDTYKLGVPSYALPLKSISMPLAPLVGIRVPLSQQVGTYYAFNVPVYSDLNCNDQWDIGEPASNPGFQLKVTVKESQITGEPAEKEQVNASLHQVDEPLDSNDPTSFARTADATPAAFMDASNGDVILFWASNRMSNPNLYPDWKTLVTNPTDSGYAESQQMMAEFAGAPWFISKARLMNSGTKWNAFSSSQWWEVSANKYPTDQWPSTLLGTDPTAFVPFWKFKGVDTTLKSVKNFSPTVSENLDVLETADSGRAWVAWAGRADTVLSNNTVAYENRIFYADTTQGKITDVYTIDHDPSSPKRYPSIALYKDIVSGKDMMWAFWQAGGGSQWSIAYSVNSDPAHLPQSADKTVDYWSADARVRLPDAISGASSPNALARIIWDKLTGSSAGYDNPQRVFDLVYAASNKISQNSDIYLSRYLAIAPGEPNARTAAPNRRAQPLPRIYNEQLERDAKYGFYTSKHIAWVRLDKSRLLPDWQTPLADNWGGYAFADADPDFPYLHVKLGAGYDIANGYARDYPIGTIVSVTDGTITLPSGTVIVPDLPATTTRIKLEIDEATGVYTYSYENPEVKAILGQALVDYSAGVVRFTKPLKEAMDTTVSPNKIKRTTVYADYTPQTWRLTTDTAVDNSPKAFIERTDMTPFNNPGMGAWPALPISAPVDRLWVLWRKVAAGASSSSIFYKTYRMGIDLTKVPGAQPVLINKITGAAVNLTVNGNLGPYEVDRTGTKIYFTSVDERYQSLIKMGSTEVFGTTGPGSISITYDGGYDEKGNVLSETHEITDISWISELPEQSFASEGNVNEGSITAFAEPHPPLGWSKIWVFWTSTRSGSSNLFWETLTPNTAGK